MSPTNRDQNRAAMPNVADLVDEVRALFPSAKVTWAKDEQTGKEVGRRSTTDGFVIPPYYGRTSPVYEAHTKKGKKR